MAIRGLIVFIVATGIGLTFSWFAGQGAATYADLPVFLLSAALAYVVNWVVFVPSAIARSEKYFDITGTLTYFTLIISALMLSPTPDTRALAVAAMVLLWATRLGLFLFVRISRDGNDRRFDQIKPNPLRFLGAWTIQALWALLSAAAAIAIITSTERQPLGAFFWIGSFLWAAGFMIEIIADRQKRAFRKDPANAGSFIQSGLWAWSRHPNYFGEILLWIGVAIIALPVLNGSQWIVLVSPLFVAFLLLKVTGVPLLDKHALEKWGDDPEYQAYRRKTPLLVPRPPK